MEFFFQTESIGYISRKPSICSHPFMPVGKGYKNIDCDRAKVMVGIMDNTKIYTKLLKINLI